MEILYTNRALPFGSRKQSYSFHHAYGNQAVFFIRLFDGSGNRILEQKIDGSKSVNVPY
jgi:hypothetical protein